MYILVVKNVNILTILIFTKYFAISYFELRLIDGKEYLLYATE
jgi:hypothetical protein